MNVIIKRGIAVCLICILMIAGAVTVSRQNTYQVSEDTQTTAEETTEAIDITEKKKPDITFWYADENYQTFFEKMAASYYKEYGIAVELRYVDSLDYMGEIYDATMEGTEFPDAYLISGAQLEEAYLYGLAAENTEASIYEASVAANAVTASKYEDKMYGYPLSYNTCLFVYQNGYFETAPASISSIIDSAEFNDPAENVQYLLEWDVNDAFFDFPFISNSVSFIKEEAETMSVNYDENLYNEDLIFFQEILESFSIDTDTVTEESVIADFKEGKTVCAIVDSNSLYQLADTDCSIIEIPDLNDTLEASSSALTDMVIVNDFSTVRQKASDFSEYLTLTMAEELYGSTNQYSVKLSEDADAMEKIAYQAYENSVLAPASMDAKEFWITLKETISQYF